MAEFPSMPLWTDAYLADTTHLTTTEHGAYLLLLIAMWRTSEKRLPNDDHRLARYAKLTSGQWARMRSTIMEFFRVDGDWITQGRLTDEAALVKSKSRQQSDNARARWRKNNETADATALPEVSRSDAPTSTPTPTSTDSSLRSESVPADQPDKEVITHVKRATRLSADWGPSEECRAFAIGLGLDPASILASFRDYWLAKPSNATKLDWPATWRSWCRREAERRDRESYAPVGRSGHRQMPPSDLAAARRAAARFKAER